MDLGLWIVMLDPCKAELPYSHEENGHKEARHFTSSCSEGLWTHESNSLPREFWGWASNSPSGSCQGSQSPRVLSAWEQGAGVASTVAFSGTGSREGICSLSHSLRMGDRGEGLRARGAAGPVSPVGSWWPGKHLAPKKHSSWWGMRSLLGATTLNHPCIANSCTRHRKHTVFASTDVCLPCGN